jgi:hypothetical protein
MMIIIVILITIVVNMIAIAYPIAPLIPLRQKKQLQSAAAATTIAVKY